MSTKALKNICIAKVCYSKKCKTGIINVDDKNWENVTKNHTCDIIKFGINSENVDLRAENIKFIMTDKFLGMGFDVTGKVNDKFEVAIPGRFSVYNALCAITIANELGLKVAPMKKALETAGVVASYEFYEKFLVKLSNSHFDGTDKIFLLPCYLTRVNSQGEEKVSHSYIIYYSDTDINDIFLYSNQKGAVERIEPELLKKFLETNLHIGYKDLKTMMRPKSEFGKKKLEQYINGKTKTDGISLDD